jgi:hypothetical protein
MLFACGSRGALDDMKTWLYVRFALVALSFLQGALLEMSLPHPEDVSVRSLLLVLGFGILGMIFVIGVQCLNPRSAPMWRYPSWHINPFLLREPLQFFHLGSFVMFSVVAGSVLRAVGQGQPLQLSVLLPLVFGAGILVGVYVCTFVFRGKMTPPNKPQPIARDNARPG